MRENLNSLVEDIVTDTTVKPGFSFLRGGVIDWDFQSSQGSRQLPEQSLNTSLGALFLNGKLNVNMNFRNNTAFDYENQSINWHWVNDDCKLIKQMHAGLISPGMISSVMSPMMGFGVSNSPSKIKKVYGEYEIIDHTEPGWDVELYINNVLVDFTTADANGEFSFLIPLVYGLTNIKMKYYGPWGEERTKEQSIQIPFVFVPHKKLEYQAYGGYTFDTLQNKFALGMVNYGLSRHISLGLGYEYFDKNEISSEIPFISSSISIGSGVLLNVQYHHNVVGKSSLFLRLNKSLNLESDFSYYMENQDAISASQEYESSLRLSFPYKLGFLSGFSRCGLKTQKSIGGMMHYGEIKFSNYAGRLNFTTGLMMSLNDNSNEYTINAGLGYSFKHGWRFYSQYNLDADEMQSTNINLQLQKRIGTKFYLSASYNHNFENNDPTLNINLRYDFAFVKSSFSSTHGKNSNTYSQSLSGSFFLNTRTPFVNLQNKSSVGRCGIDVIPFLDINHNVKMDKDEPQVDGLYVNITKGYKVDLKDSTRIRFVGLEPFTRYILTIENAGLPYISWILPFETAAIFPQANTIKQFKIGILPMGEIYGSVYAKKDGKLLEAARIILNIYNDKNEKVAGFLTESDGYFSYIGLSPGNYTVRFDETQMKNIGLAKPDDIPFEIKESFEGDIVGEMKVILNEI
jgi:hypothetical protein